MVSTHFSAILRQTALLAALMTMTACSTMNDTYNELMGDETAPTEQKVGVKSPAAAPVQSVNTQEITTNTPTTSTQTVELGSMSDKPLSAPPQTITAQAPEPAAPAPAAAPAPIASNTVALLTIRFNQPHVYYEDALTQAVKSAEQAKPGVMYEVLSTIPDLSSLTQDQQDKLSARAKDNLHNVVVKMQQQGVSPDRIRIADQTLKIRSQEIRIFVR